MVDRKPISDAQRFGVWKAWGGRCAWCRQPVLFKDCHIDHIIPLAAVATAYDRADALSQFGLPVSFNIDDFENWVCACPSCNLRKSETLLDTSPILLLLLNKARLNASVARAITTAIEADRKKPALLIKLKNALKRGDLTEADIRELLYGLPVLIQKSAAETPVSSLWIAPGWEIKEQRGNLVFVGMPSGRFGYTSTSNDQSWFCPHCGQKGPWNGVICLSCGNRSDPDD
jgi:5-methylcytosine-specific restriction endonuclease McrA